MMIRPGLLTTALNFCVCLNTFINLFGLKRTDFGVGPGGYLQWEEFDPLQVDLHANGQAPNLAKLVEKLETRVPGRFVLVTFSKSSLEL